MREVIDTAKEHGCLSSDYFYSEYVCDTPKGRGLLHMLRDIQESAQVFGINSVDPDESFALLLEGEGNMNGDVKIPENTESDASTLLPPISS
jgi:hypothetical protein